MPEFVLHVMMEAIQPNSLQCMRSAPIALLWARIAFFHASNSVCCPADGLGRRPPLPVPLYPASLHQLLAVDGRRPVRMGGGGGVECTFGTPHFHGVRPRGGPRRDGLLPRRRPLAGRAAGQ